MQSFGVEEKKYTKQPTKRMFTMLLLQQKNYPKFRDDQHKKKEIKMLSYISQLKHMNL